MARAFKCDLCGWFFTKDGKTLIVADLDCDISNLDNFEDAWEICPKCYDKFKNKFINYIKEEKSEQGTYNSSTRRFTPYEEPKKEAPKIETITPPVVTKPKRLTCKGCRYLDSTRISGKGYQCNCLTNNTMFTEPSRTRCSKYEEG